jgi:hypothetical protein
MTCNNHVTIGKVCDYGPGTVDWGRIERAYYDGCVLDMHWAWHTPDGWKYYPCDPYADA